MATKPELRRAVANGYIKASDYNYNFEQLNNYIEAGTALATYEPSAEYKKNQWVLAEVGGEFGIYQSLFDGNKGTSLLDGTYWKKVSLGAGLEIGDIGFTQMAIDESKGKRRKLNGQVIIQDQYVQFTSIIKNSVALNPELACTESEWQTAVTMSTIGICYKFVINDEAGTIRLPKYPNYFIGGVNNIASVVGNGTGLGLISSNDTLYYATNLDTPAGGVLYARGGSAILGDQTQKTGIPKGTVGVSTDPTKSGIEAQIKQEKIVGTYFIQVATGAETEDNIINEIELNNPFSLLDYKFSEYELNNLSWLRSNGQYNSKAVYPAVYDLLLKIYNGTETKAGVSVKLWNDESATDYDFRINTAEETFRLPIKVKLASGKAVVGNGNALGVTDGTNTLSWASDVSGTRHPACTDSGVNVGSARNTKAGPILSNVALGITTDPTKSGIETSDSGFYLYFYVGETVQNANLINAGRIQEKVAEAITRMDCKAYITETYVNGASGYNVYSNGYCEQWGRQTVTANGATTITFLKPFKNTEYYLDCASYIGGTSANSGGYSIQNAQAWNATASGFTTYGLSAHSKSWQACGYIA